MKKQLLPADKTFLFWSGGVERGDWFFIFSSKGEFIYNDVDFHGFSSVLPPTHSLNIHVNVW